MPPPLRDRDFCDLHSEPMWPIEARNAAIANTYFVGANNRVGTVSAVKGHHTPDHLHNYVCGRRSFQMSSHLEMVCLLTKTLDISMVLVISLHQMVAELL